jgi:MoxR-like ATPase
MQDESKSSWYKGDGRTIEERGLELPPFKVNRRLNAADLYEAEPGLRDAVNVAIALGQPLLVTGEPGTGKTQLANSIAYELQLPDPKAPEPLPFYTKTTSTAKDLFYQYDALSHFRDVTRQKEQKIEKYIKFEALGLAILLAMDPAEANRYLPEDLRGKGPTRSVVLIDEIDKAPRDLPNDILTEIDTLSFEVREFGVSDKTQRRHFAAEDEFRPIVILTSNSEKNLPDAFLRRCVFYHITPPDDARLRKIADRRVPLDPKFKGEMLGNAINHFIRIREDLGLRKKPATAEFLSWVRILNDNLIDVSNPAHKGDLALSYAVLVKNKDDRDRLAETFLR